MSKDELLRELKTALESQALAMAKVDYLKMQLKHADEVGDFHLSDSVLGKRTVEQFNNEKEWMEKRERFIKKNHAKLTLEEQDMLIDRVVAKDEVARIYRCSERTLRNRLQDKNWKYVQLNVIGGQGKAIYLDSLSVVSENLRHGKNLKGK